MTKLIQAGVQVAYEGALSGKHLRLELEGRVAPFGTFYVRVSPPEAQVGASTWAQKVEARILREVKESLTFRKERKAKLSGVPATPPEIILKVVADGENGAASFRYVAQGNYMKASRECVAALVVAYSEEWSLWQCGHDIRRQGSGMYAGWIARPTLVYATLGNQIETLLVDPPTLSDQAVRVPLYSVTCDAVVDPEGLWEMSNGFPDNQWPQGGPDTEIYFVTQRVLERGWMEANGGSGMFQYEEFDVPPGKPFELAAIDVRNLSPSQRAPFVFRKAPVPQNDTRKLDLYNQAPWDQIIDMVQQRFLGIQGI